MGIVTFGGASAGGPKVSIIGQGRDPIDYRIEKELNNYDFLLKDGKF